MAVIAFPNFQPQGSGVTDLWKQRTITARHQSPMGGVTTTLERPNGSQWVCTPRFNNLDGSRRAIGQQFLVNNRGFGSRFYMPTFWTRRGSFSAPELLTNNLFNGTTGWTAQQATLTASDGILRITPEAAGSNPGALQSAAMTQYVPYALRSLLLNSAFAYTAPRNFIQDPGAVFSVTSTAGFGLTTTLIVPVTTGSGSTYCGYISDTNGYLPSHYLNVGYSSLARCALVDNGPCFTQRSQELDNAYWTKTQVTVTANAGAAPDRTTTADTIIENGANAAHFITRTETRSAAAADWCVSGYFTRASGTRNLRLVCGRDASNYVHASFDLGAGTISVAAAAVGDATAARAFIAALGDGQYYCAIIGRLTATTGLYLEAGLLSGTTVSYTGDSASGVHGWRFGAAQTSVPTRGMVTTSAGDSDGTLQTGSTLYLKGLPASTNGLLLQGDWVEVITNTSSQGVRARAPLNSDAAGMGVLEFEAPLRISPLDNAVVVVCNPLIRSMLDRPEVEWSEHDDGFSSLEFTASEDTYP